MKGELNVRSACEHGQVAYEVESGDEVIEPSTG
jgi:hypothetical protein